MAWTPTQSVPARACPGSDCLPNEPCDWCCHVLSASQCLAIRAILSPVGEGSPYLAATGFRPGRHGLYVQPLGSRDDDEDSLRDSIDLSSPTDLLAGFGEEVSMVLGCGHVGYYDTSRYGRLVLDALNLAG